MAVDPHVEDIVDLFVEDLLRQAGVWIAKDPAELLETAKVFSLCPLPRGRKVLTVTASGSLGVMAADRIVEEGLDLAELPDTRLSRLREKTPPWMNLRNPLDVGPSGLFREAMNVALEAPEVDGVLAFPVVPWAVVSSLLRENPAAVESMFVDRAVLERAQALSGSDYEDNVQIACAEFNELDAIVTRNPSDYEGSPIVVWSPAECLKNLQGKRIVAVGGPGGWGSPEPSPPAPSSAWRNPGLPFTPSFPRALMPTPCP